MELTSGIVCILDAYSRPAGAGFVVSTVMENLIVTCAHVLGEPRPERVTIVFQSTGEQQEAKVIDQWWRSEEAEDVAILRIVGCLPPGVQPLPLGSAKGTVGHDVSTFGFPNVGQVKGMGGDGTVVEQVTTMAGLSLLQLRSSEITPGFSGAPVWDKLKHRVIGMVIEITLPDQYSRLTETAFAVPMETLRTVCPALCISEVCPYRSLEIFTEADTEFFFGRKRVVDELVNSLQQEPHFLAVFGPSGSGKSSVVRAGLLPQLQLGRVSGSDRWEIKVTRPTEHTFEQLLSHLYQETQKQTVLVIDQFEELFVAFSEVVYQEIATRLTGLLESSSRITLILVMRDDFYSRFVQQETLAGWLRRGLVNMPHTLKRDEVVAMIEEPAHAVGLRFQEGLIEIIVDDVLERIVRAKDSGRVSSSTILPLLEFALTQLWERRQEGMMTRNAYEVIGGVTGGLAQWAAREFYSLNEQQRAFTRRIFTDLVYLGNESQGLPNSRQRRSLVSLVHRDDERGIIQHIVGQLTQARLLVASQDDKSNEETIEIIHEALLHEWGQLKEWIREDRDFLNWRQEIERQAKLWVETYRDDPAQCEVGRLLRGRDLTTAVNWLEEREADLDQLIWDFIKVSQRCEQQEEQKWKELYQESERQRQIILARDLATQAEWIRSQQTHKLQLSILLTVESMQRCPSSRTDRLLREGLTLLPRCITRLTYNEVVRSIALSPDGQFLAVASRGHLVEIYTMPDGHHVTQLQHNDIVRVVTFSPDGCLLATASGDCTARIWNIHGDEIACFKHDSGVITVAFSPDGRYLVTTSLNFTVRIWEIASMQVLVHLAYRFAVSALAFSPDGRYLAIASYGDRWCGETGTATLLEISTHRCTDIPHHIYLEEHIYHVEAFIFSPNSQSLAVVDHGNVGIWDVPNGKELINLEHEDIVINSVAFHPDGAYLVTASNVGFVEVWRADGKSSFHKYPEVCMKHDDSVAVAVFGPDGTFLIATASDDGTARLWDVVSAEQVLSLTHEGAVKNVIMSPDGQYLVTASDDRTVRIWEAKNTYQSSICLAHNGPVKTLSFSPDNTLIATASDDQTARIWEVVSGTQVACLNHHGKVRSVAFHPNDGTVLTASYDGTVKRWNTRSGSELACLTSQNEVRKVIFSPNGHYFATSGYDQTIRLWKAINNHLVAGLLPDGVVNDVTFSHDGGYLAKASNSTLSVWNMDERRQTLCLSFVFPVHRVVFSPNGHYLAAAIGCTARTWEIATGQELSIVTHEKEIWAIAFSPDSRYIATASIDYTARVWDTCNGKQVAQLAHKDTVWDVAFSPDSKYVATASWDSTACIWEMISGRQIACLTHNDRVDTVAFSPDGKYVATASRDHTAQIWLWQPNDIIAEIRSRLSRNLTLEEWQQYLGDEPYNKTYSDLP